MLEIDMILFASYELKVNINLIILNQLIYQSKSS